jgi:hypothetical protein
MGGAFTALALRNLAAAARHRGDPKAAGETTLTDIWFKAEAQKIAKQRGVPCTEELLQEAKATLTPPKNIDFRMS